MAEESNTGERHWAKLAHRRGLPLFIRRYAEHRWTIAHAQISERIWGRHDPDDNQDTRIPDGEHVGIPGIWLTELYTPTTLAGLLDGLPPLMAKARYQHPERGDLIDWVQSSRRQGGGAWRMLPEARSAGGRHLSDDIVDDLPFGITSVTWGIYTLTSTVTAVTAAFHVQEDRALELQRIINHDVSTRAILTPGGGFKISDVRWQKQESADRSRESLRREAARWLADRIPGSFHRLTPGQLPTIELLLTEKQSPWDEPASDRARTRGWTQLLGLEAWDGYWQSTGIPWLRLRERETFQWTPSQRHVLTLAARRADLKSSASFARDDASALEEAIYFLHLHVIPFANRHALTALLHELEGQLASIRDLSERATSQRSPKALTQIQQQLISTGLDNQIVAADIARYARDEKWWRHDVLDFTKVIPPSLTAYMNPQESLTETMRQGQDRQGSAVAQAEADLRDVINSSAQLTAAAENIRLQRSVRWLAIVSLIIAIIAAVATIVALYISSHPPKPASNPTPIPRPSVAQSSVPTPR